MTFVGMGKERKRGPGLAVEGEKGFLMSPHRVSLALTWMTWMLFLSPSSSPVTRRDTHTTSL